MNASTAGPAAFRPLDADRPRNDNLASIPTSNIPSRAGSDHTTAVLGLPLRDVTSGVKGVARRALKVSDFDAIRSTGYSFQIEVTYRCHQQGSRIVEAPLCSRIAG